MDRPRVLYIVSSCPVDPGFGQVLVLKRRDERQPVYFCPACGTAWTTPPGQEIHEVNSLEELAPAGAEIVSEKDLYDFGIVHEVDDTIPYSNWADDLDEVLGSTKPLVNS